jgi:hypothetical protein
MTTDTRYIYEKFRHSELIFVPTCPVNGDDYVSGNWSDPNLGIPHRTETITESFGDTVQRVRPADLIANPTARHHYSYDRLVEGLAATPFTPLGTQYLQCLPGSDPANWHFYGQQARSQKTFSPPGLPDELSGDLDWPLRLRLKIKRQKVNLGTSLVEYKQTTKMFGSFAKGIKNAWSSYKHAKRNFFSIRDSSRRRIRPCDIPASYLSTTYGLEPLISDLMNSIYKLTDRLQKPMYQKFTVKCSSDGKTDSGYTWSRSLRATAFLRSIPSSDQFTLGNVGELAWEVVPFSFVVDWGIGVGDWLSSLDALDGLEFVSGTLTAYDEAEGKFAYDVDDGYSGVISSERYHKNLGRTTFSSIPLPTRPRFGFSGSYRRLANGVALLWAVNQRCKS